MKINNSNIDTLINQNIIKYHIKGVDFVSIEGGELSYHKSYGIKDTSLNPVTDKTLFEAASLTKTMFSTLIMRLIDRDVIKLDTPIVKQGGLIWSNDERFKLITPRMVLSHSSGLKGWQAPPLDFIFDPSTSYSYSGVGYFLLQKLVESKLNKRLDDIYKEEFFIPLKMNSFLYFTKDIQNDFSFGFDSKGNVNKVRDCVDDNPIWAEPCSAWSLYTNAIEYSKFIIDYLNNHSNITATTFKEMVKQTSHAYRNVSWALGFGLTDNYLWHWGDNSGFKNFVILDIENKNAIIIFTNSDNGMDLYIDVLKTITDINYLDDVKEFILQAE